MSLDEDAVYRTIGSRVRTVRDGQRPMQARIADLAGLHRTSVTNLEAGRQRRPIHLPYHFANCLKVAPQELLT